MGCWWGIDSSGAGFRIESIIRWIGCWYGNDSFGAGFESTVVWIGCWWYGIGTISGKGLLRCSKHSVLLEWLLLVQPSTLHRRYPPWRQHRPRNWATRSQFCEEQNIFSPCTLHFPPFLARDWQSRNVHLFIPPCGQHNPPNSAILVHPGILQFLPPPWARHNKPVCALLGHPGNGHFLPPPWALHTPRETTLVLQSTLNVSKH